MKLRIDKHVLADAVTDAAKALPNRPSVPVLAGVLLRATNGTLVVSSFDYEVSNEITCAAQVDSDGAALVSGRLLSEITKALPAKPVDIAAVGTHLELACGSARFTLPTMPAEDYPELPQMPASVGTIDATVFAAAVTQVAIAAGRDETLPMMTGVRIEANGTTLALLATDRYRLALREIPWTPTDPAFVGNTLVPARILNDTAKILGPLGGDISIALNADANGIFGMSTAGRHTTSRLLDGANYPPVRSLFPKEFAAHATVRVADLEQVVKRVALVAERTTPVLLSFSPDGLVVEAGGSEDARASEAMEATFTGDPLTIGFNPAYLLDGVHHLGTATAHISFVDAFKPAVISPADGDGKVTDAHRYLIMPIRVTR